MAALGNVGFLISFIGGVTIPGAIAPSSGPSISQDNSGKSPLTGPNPPWPLAAPRVQPITSDGMFSSE